MKLAEKMLRIGQDERVHRLTRGKFHKYVHRYIDWRNRKVSHIVTNDGFVIYLPSYGAVSRHLISDGEFEPDIRDLIVDIVSEGDLVANVGANIGYHTVLMASLTDRVIALEPDPENFLYALANLTANDLKAEQLLLKAASDQHGEAPLWLDPRNPGGHSMELSDNRPYELVETVRLDEILPPGKIKLILMDIEGHEAAAIRGLGDRVRDVENIIYEHWVGGISEDPELLLEGAGFVVKNIDSMNYIAARVRGME